MMNRASARDTMLIGLIGGLGLGVCNLIVYLFFVLPIIAHDLFHSYMHYGASVLEFAAGYVGILGLLGMPTALLTARALTKRSGNDTNAREALPYQRPLPK